MASLGLFLFLSLALVPAVLGGLSAELIHRDSPISPLYDPSATHFDRWRLAAERSHERARHFASRLISTSSIVSPVVPSSWSYLIKLSLGTPPVDIYAIADTGSDLTWAYCKVQNDSLFDPAKSSTYSSVMCGTNSCNALPTESRSCDTDNNCQYKYPYGDGSRYVIGLLANENFAFSSSSGGAASVVSTVFGCSDESKGTFGSSGGLVGLGGGELSLVSQLGASIQNQFSYCLPYIEVNKSSQFVFGPNDRAPSGQILKTPLIKIPDLSTFYVVTLNSITVGETSIPVDGQLSGDSTGNIVVDSGTMLTMLNQNVVDAVVAEVRKVIRLPLSKRPEYEKFGACFFMIGSEKDLKLPEISFVFNGATVPLKHENTFIHVDRKFLCLAIGPAYNVQIYGSIAQQGFYLGYDIGQKQLSIAPANCDDF